MKNVLVEIHDVSVMTTIKVFDEKNIDAMLTAVTTIDAKIFSVSDEFCTDTESLCSHLQQMQSEGRFITLDKVGVRT